MSGKSLAGAFDLPENWMEMMNNRMPPRTPVAVFEKRKQGFLTGLQELRKLCITSQLVFDDVIERRISPCGKVLVSVYQDLWKRNIGPVTTYAHLLANHVYELLEMGIDLGALSTESIELINKQWRNVIARMTSNGQPLAPQLLRYANRIEFAANMRK